ncbi:MAG: CBS domain-containing protein [Spirochaetota bacterium]
MSDEKHKTDAQEDLRELLKEFHENPFDPSRKTPEDVMRVFYQFNIPIVPVVSRRNTLIGVITKEEITAEMSDIERFSSRKIDDFITRIARKRTMNEILPYISDVNEFVVINIFGEVQGRWSRVDLISACEGTHPSPSAGEEITDSRDQKAMEWMIYLILEHIPRALYALNADGKTIFYNSYFEDLYLSALGGEDVDHVFAEQSLADIKRNEYTFRGAGKKDILFYNLDMKFHYEKVPMFSNGEKVGYLVYCGQNPEDKDLSPGDISLADRLSSAERQILVEAIARAGGDLSSAAKALSVTKTVLMQKARRLGIDIPASPRPADKKRGKK